MTLRDYAEGGAAIAFVAGIVALGGYGIVSGVRESNSNQRVLGACSVYSCDVGTPAVVTYPLKSSAWHCACVAGGLQ